MVDLSYNGMCIYIECMIVNKLLYNIFYVGVNDLDFN